jgi:hypothetical protein
MMIQIKLVGIFKTFYCTKLAAHFYCSSGTPVFPDTPFGKQ